MNGRVVFVIPCYNASSNLKGLIESLMSQDSNAWRAVIIDDMSTDDSVSVAKQLIQKNDATHRILLVENTEKKYALRNVVDTVKNRDMSLNFVWGPRDIVAILDADDKLCNDKTVSLLLKAYDESFVNKEEYEESLKQLSKQAVKDYDGESVIRVYDSTAIWTAHRWDSNGMNISGALPEKVNPYQFPWVTSHLKTFDYMTLATMNDDNFKDMDGKWFERGYDQALYLPILFKSKVRKYIPDVCYQYNLNSPSIVRTGDETPQLRAINLVRARGFIE